MAAIILDAGALVPAAWRDRLAGGASSVFNPSLTQFRGELLLAYRVVLPDMLRRLAVCRLDRRLAVVPGSALPLSDLVAFPPRPEYTGRLRRWLADPRLVHDGSRLLVHWNSGMHPPRNAQFVQALDPDTLRPVGYARELRTEPAAACEKNWTLFSHGGSWHAGYSVVPHRVLRLADGGAAGTPVEGVEVARHPWRAGAYARRFGEPRGGTPPVRVGARYYTFFHSSHGPRRGRRYRVGALAFEAEPPFAPQLWSPTPLDLPNPFGRCPPRDRLSPGVAESLFPCGAVLAEGAWIVSYGINNRHCALTVIEHAELEAGLRPVEPAGDAREGPRSSERGLVWRLAAAAKGLLGAP